jgi:hypothetical protein
MDIAFAVFRRDFLKKTFEIGTDIGVGILLDEQRGRGVAAENRQESSRNFLLV